MASRQPAFGRDRSVGKRGKKLQKAGLERRGQRWSEHAAVPRGTSLTLRPEELGWRSGPRGLAGASSAGAGAVGGLAGPQSRSVPAQGAGWALWFGQAISASESPVPGELVCGLGGASLRGGRESLLQFLVGQAGSSVGRQEGVGLGPTGRWLSAVKASFLSPGSCLFLCPSFL